MQYMQTACHFNKLILKQIVRPAALYRARWRSSLCPMAQCVPLLAAFPLKMQAFLFGTGLALTKATDC